MAAPPLPLFSKLVNCLIIFDFQAAQVSEGQLKLPATSPSPSPKPMVSDKPSPVAEVEEPPTGESKMSDTL